MAKKATGRKKEGRRPIPIFVLQSTFSTRKKSTGGEERSEIRKIIQKKAQMNCNKKQVISPGRDQPDKRSPLGREKRGQGKGGGKKKRLGTTT